MPKFSNRSLTKLRTCHPMLQELCQRIVEHHDITILVGHRTQAEQDEMHRTRRSQKSWPNSRHNTSPSMAVDVAPWPIPADWGGLGGATNHARDLAWKERVKFYEVVAVARFCWSQMLSDFPELADQHKLRFGADWDGDRDYRDQSFDDLVHIELRPAASEK